MESDDLSFRNLLSQIRSCYSKWDELKRERDALKSSLENANHKIVELETTIARYKAKDFVIEKERYLLSRIINTLHEELVKEGPISKKIDEIEEDVSWLSKAVEKSISDFDKRSSSVNASDLRSRSYEKGTKIHIQQGVPITNVENNEQSSIDDIDLHGIVDDDEFSTPYSGERSKPSLLQQALTQPRVKQDVNFLEFSNIFSFYSTLFSVSENAQSKSVSVGNKTLKKSDDSRVFLTDLIASSSHWLTNHDGNHNESYSFSKNGITSSAVTTSSDFSFQKNREVNELDHTSEEIISNQNEPDFKYGSDVDSDTEMVIRNTYNLENLSQISATSLESTYSDISRKITSNQNKSNFSSDNDRYEDFVGSDTELAIQNNLENSSQIGAASLKSVHSNTSKEITSEHNPNFSSSDNNGYGDVIGSSQSLTVQSLKNSENSPRICGSPSQLVGFNIPAENFMDVENVEEDLLSESRKNSDSDKTTKVSCVVKIPYLRYNLRERKFIKNDKYLNGDGYSPSDSSHPTSNSSIYTRMNIAHCKKEGEATKNENYLSVIPSTTSNYVDPCSTSEQTLSVSSLNSLICTSDKTTSEYKKSRPCDFCGKMFARSLDLKIHIKQEHLSLLGKTLITCEHCKYVANSAKTMDIHKLKRHNIRKFTSRPKINVAENTIEEAAFNKYVECVICKKRNLGGMKFQSSRDLDSHISKNHPNSFPDYFPCPHRSDYCNRHFTSIKNLQKHLKTCIPKKKYWRQTKKVSQNST